MQLHGDYSANGYALIDGLLQPELAKALLEELWQDVHSEKVRFSFAEDTGLVSTRCTEMHGSRYPPLKTFLWGVTPYISMLAARPLLPSYCFFRLYKRGDLLRVHSDRNECEHSLSLTLGYSDAKIWPLEIGRAQVSGAAGFAGDFGEEEMVRLPMQPGDAVLYRGTSRRHGRTTPNPNSWSAHLFMHWVDAGGPYRDRAFEKSQQPAFD